MKLVEDVESARLVAETDRLRAALLTSISHDLRTPLASILGSATSLHARGCAGCVDKDDLIRNIQEEAERLNRFIGNLLDMTRLKSGALALRTGPIDCRTSIGSALARAQSKILARHRYAGVLQPNLPMLDWMRCCSSRSVQPAGQRQQICAGRIPDHYKAWQENDQVVVQVSDEGPGIPADELERVFDKFYRAGGPDRRRVGTGLGLAICRGFVEAMRGSIRPSNRTDRSGAVFTFGCRLPSNAGRRKRGMR